MPSTQGNSTPGGSSTAIIGAASNPRLSLNPTVFNFGDVPVGVTITQQVTLSNSGNASVNITSVPPSSNGFSHDLLPMNLSPGQSVQFNVSFAPAATGAASGSVSIVSTAQGSPTVLTLTGNATVPTPGSLVANPSSITFGDTVVGTTASQTVTLMNAGGTPVSISSFNGPGPGFSVTGLPAIPPNLVLTPGQSRLFTVSYAPTVPGGPPPPSAITFQSDAANPTTTISLSGGNAIAQVLSLSVTPAAIDFGDVAVGSTDSRTVSVTNTGNFDVNITGSTVLPLGEFSVTGLTTGLLGPGLSRQFTVQFQPGTLGAATQRTISLTSNPAAASNSITVNGNGIVQPLGTLSFSPAIVDFGDVIVGTTPPPSQTVTLTNTGNAALTIASQPAPPGSGFTLTGFTTGPLAPGASRTFSVQFAPSVAGLVTPNLSIVSTNSSNSPTSIPLRGNGVAQNLQLTLNPAVIDFGNVVTGTTDSRIVTVTNTGNFGVNITGSTVSPAGGGFSVTGLATGLLAPGASRTFTVQFLPTPPGGLVSRSISLTSNPAATSTPASVSVSGTGAVPGQLNLNPSSINFGNVVVGNSDTRSITVMNTGGAPVDVTSIAVTAGGAVFSIGNFVPGPSPPTQTVAPGGSITFTVTFTPTAVSPPGTITVNSTAGNPTVSLSGTGVAQTLTLTASPPSVSFGNVTVGTNVSQVVTLTNTGNTSVTGITASNPGGAFSVTATPPATLAPGATGTFTVQFLPASVGPAPAASVLVTSNAPIVTVALSGNGTAVPVGALSLNPTSLNFGSVVVGNTTPAQTVTMTNTGNGPAVTINTITPNPPGVFTAVIVGAPLPRTLTNPGDSATFTVQFTPAAAGPVPGSAVVATSANSPSLTLSGTGAAPAPMLSASPTSLNFGTVSVGSSSPPLTVTLTNTGNATVTGITATPSAEFIVTAAPPATLAPGLSGTFSVQFSPAAPGVPPGTPTVGTVSVASTNAPAIPPVSLSGTAVVPVLTLTVSPTNINFGDVLIGGAGVTQNVTLLNSGASDITLTINPATGTGAANYSVPGLTLPFTQTLTAGQSSTFPIRFLPTAAVTSDASIRISSNASNSPTDITLSGRGTTGIKLSWDASPTLGVVGYNLYRRVGVSAPVRLNASLIPGLTFTDTTATPGQTYVYTVTALDPDGIESLPSNLLTITIP